MRIWKFPLAICGSQTVIMPTGARILAVKFQGNILCLWAEVDSAAPVENRIILIFGTGHPLPARSIKYIATVFEEALGLVWHIYEDAA